MTEKLKRNLQAKAEYLLTIFPVLAILGVRQCGKTTLAKQLFPTARYLDLENSDHLAELMRDPAFFFQNYPQNLIVDEAQLYPEVFRRLRGVVDAERNTQGRFIITGSSSPELLQNISESLAGRVAIIELGTLKANEWEQAPLSDLYHWFEEKINPASLASYCTHPLPLKTIQEVWGYGGYPEPLLKQDPQAWALWMEFYRATYINRDIAALFPQLNRFAYQRFLGVLSQLSGTILNRSQLGRDIEVSEKTIRDYLSIAEGTFLWRQLPAFESPLKSMVKLPKGYLRDSGLLHYLLRYRHFDDVLQSPQIGRLFEGFVIEELLKGFSASQVTDYQAFYYRTRGGVEIDLILEGPFGTLPIEIESGIQVQEKRLKNLEQFIKEQKLSCGLLINQAEHPEWITPHIFQLPVTYL